MCGTTIAVATRRAHAQIAELLVMIGNAFCLRGWSFGSPKQMSACVISSLLGIAQTQKLPLIDLTADTVDTTFYSLQEPCEPYLEVLLATVGSS